MPLLWRLWLGRGPGGRAGRRERTMLFVLFYFLTKQIISFKGWLPVEPLRHLQTVPEVITNPRLSVSNITMSLSSLIISPLRSQGRDSARLHC